jgi:hypothetical protein
MLMSRTEVFGGLDYLPALGMDRDSEHITRAVRREARGGEPEAEALQIR